MTGPARAKNRVAATSILAEIQNEMHIALSVAALVAAGPAFAEYSEVEVRDGGSIRGKITYNGKPPAPQKVAVTRDSKVCGPFRADETFIVGADGGVKNVVVYLSDVASGKKMDRDLKPVLDQKDCNYLPRLQVVPLHSTLLIKSSDLILHNVHSFLNGSTVINVAVPPKRGLVLGRKLDQAGGQQLKCDVHGFMRGGIFVADNPYFAVTSEDGTFAIVDVPPGTYTLNTWHEAAGSLAEQVTLAPGASATFNGKIR
jgi:hypothetical protein